MSIFLIWFFKLSYFIFFINFCILVLNFSPMLPKLPFSPPFNLNTNFRFLMSCKVQISNQQKQICYRDLRIKMKTLSVHITMPLKSLSRLHPSWYIISNYLPKLNFDNNQRAVLITIYNFYIS